MTTAAVASRQRRRTIPEISSSQNHCLILGLRAAERLACLLSRLRPLKPFFVPVVRRRKAKKSLTTEVKTMVVKRRPAPVHGESIRKKSRLFSENRLKSQAMPVIVQAMGLKHPVQRGSRFPSTAAIPEHPQFRILDLTCRRNPGSTLYECFNALSPFLLSLKQTAEKIKHSMPYTAEA